MTTFRVFLIMIVLLGGKHTARTEEPEKRQVLFVCHSISFIHPAVVPAERALRELGKQAGFELTCFRYTHDPEELASKKTRIFGRATEPGKSLLKQYRTAFKATTGESIGPEHCGRLDAETLSRFHAVVFYTKDDPCGTDAEKQALLDFVRSGKGFVGAHSATVTHFDWTEYGNMLGGYFDVILFKQAVPLWVEDRTHPSTAHFGSRVQMEHEVYQFRAPYNRDKVDVLLRVDPNYAKAIVRQVKDGRAKAAELGKAGKKKQAEALLRSLPRLSRTDGDFAVSWCRDYGKGRVFYTALGHFPEQWSDVRFRRHILGGLLWTMNQTNNAQTSD